MANPVAVLHFDVLTSTAIASGVQGGGYNLYLPAWCSLTTTAGNLVAYNTGRKVGSSCLGGNTVSTNASSGLTISRGSIGVGSSVWITAGIKFNAAVGVTNATGTNIAFFQWGDVSVWINSTTQIQIKNNGSVIATLTHPGLIAGVWYDLLIYVQLNASTGAASITFDGITAASATNLNTVSVTPLASATLFTWTLAFGGGFNYSSHFFDDCFIFTSAPPVDANGNQIYPKATLDYANADTTLSNFAGSPSGTVSAALQTIGGSLAKGSIAGASAILTPTNRATIPADAANLLGINVIAQGCKKLDSTARTLQVGVTLSGTDDLSAGSTLATSTATTIDYTVANTYVDSDWNAGNIKLKLLVS